jgi:hypothetical protein
MRALMWVMLQHPLLLELPVGAQCGSLPGEGLVEEVGALKHPYGGPVRLEDYDEDQVDEVEEIMERCREEWNEECKALHIFRRLHAADPTMPSNNFLKIASKCTRPQASLLIQLRTGRIGLNRHLHQLSQADDPFCPHCPHVEETVRHLLLECPKYWKERLFVQRRLRRKAFDMKTLISDPKAIHLTLKFVAQTRRLEDSYGDTLKK